MHIIIEGVDKSGKTTLANKLSKELGLPIVKFSKPKGDAYIEYVSFLVNNQEPAILDRFHLGEDTYGPVKRGQSALDPQRRFVLEGLLISKASVNIYAEVPIPLLKENLVKDKEDFINQTEALQIRTLYHEHIKKSQLEWYTFDYTKDPDYEKVLEYCERCLMFPAAFTDLRVLGGLAARTLILGYENNYKREPKEIQDIMVPFMKGPSAVYLEKALGIAGISLYDVVIGNAVKFYESPSSLEYELTLPNLKRVICLGEKSTAETEKEMNRIGVTLPIFTIPHPSYASRFQIPIKEYAKQLKALVK